MPSLIGNEFSCRFPLCFPVAGLQGPWALPPLIGRANPFLGAHIIIGQQTVHSLELWMLQKNVATFQCVGGPPFLGGQFSMHWALVSVTARHRFADSNAFIFLH